MPIERLVDVFDNNGQHVGRYIVEMPGPVQDVVYERRAIDYAIQHARSATCFAQSVAAQKKMPKD